MTPPPPPLNTNAKVQAYRGGDVYWGFLILAQIIIWVKSFGEGGYYPFRGLYGLLPLAASACV